MHRNTRTESLSARVSTANWAEEREVLDSWIHADSARPVYSAIRSAFIEQFSLLYMLLSEKTRRSCEAYKKEHAEPARRLVLPESMPSEWVQLDKDCTTLTGLLFNRSNVWAAQDWQKPPILKFLLRCLKRNKAGRPLTRLGIAVQVKELRIADSKRWKWEELADKFCDCKKKEHSISCQTNLRRQVLHLENLLKRCGHPV